MGVPRSVVLAFLKGKDNRIAPNFVLEGDNDPQFSLNEVFTASMAASMAETLGVNFKGVVGGFGSLGRKGIEGVGETGKGIGGAIGSLLGGQQKR